MLCSLEDIQTGRYPVRSGFNWVLNPGSSRGIHPEETTIAEELKQSGYQTACYGKIWGWQR